MNENKYVEMVRQLAELADGEMPVPEGLRAGGLEDVPDDALYACYCRAFEVGDSQIFFQQTEEERRAFFGELGLETARTDPASVVLFKGEQAVGFTLSLPYGEGNRHISCMCVDGAFQRQGLGAWMLDHTLRQAAAQGCRTMSLWTETRMGAFQLYRKHGFKIVEVMDHE